MRATKKLLQRLSSATPPDGESSTALLGDWYATVLPWRPQQLVMLVNAHTLLPVLTPLAPAAGLPARIGPAIVAALEAHHVPAEFITAESGHMRDCRFGPTANRSIVGVTNEFAKLADVYRHSNSGLDLLRLSRWLAGTPCSPLRTRHITPDRELQAFVRQP